MLRGCHVGRHGEPASHPLLHTRKRTPSQQACKQDLLARHSIAPANHAPGAPRFKQFAEDSVCIAEHAEMPGSLEARAELQAVAFSLSPFASNSVATARIP